jgi:hypothetical protein
VRGKNVSHPGYNRDPNPSSPALLPGVPGRREYESMRVQVEVEKIRLREVTFAQE